MKEKRSLEETHPEVAAEWHPTLNGDLTPRDITRWSKQKVFWLGQCAHEWDATPDNRTSHIGRCPVCLNRKIVVGFNDLATTCPEVAKEWHPTLNGSLTPNSFSKGSNKKVWWRGLCGHDWLAIINDRVRKNSGCPTCANKEVLPGFNDLAFKYPEVAKEWHPTKNGKNMPSMITWGSNKKAWWVCAECGYEWPAVVNSRTAQRSGCPDCCGYGFNTEKEGYLYLVKKSHGSGPALLQIGITNSLKKRLRDHKKNWFFLVDLIGPMSGSYIKELEKNLKDFLSSFNSGLGETKNIVVESTTDENTLVFKENFEGYTETWLESSYPIQGLDELILDYERGYPICLKHVECNLTYGSVH